MAVNLPLIKKSEFLVKAIVVAVAICLVIFGIFLLFRNIILHEVVKNKIEEFELYELVEKLAQQMVLEKTVRIDRAQEILEAWALTAP